MDPLRQLRYFVAVAEERHFGRAADRLGMAQPPLSQRIRKLETDLGARLFDRGPGKPVELTEAGQILLAEARDLLARWDRTRTLVGKAHRGEMDALRIGVPPEVAGRLLAAILVAFESRDVRLDLQELSTAEQVRLLADRQLDAGLLQHPVDVVGLRLGPAVDTPLGVVLPRDSPLAARSTVDLADLAGTGLVIFPRAAAPGLYDVTLRTCWEHGFRPAHVHHARNPEFVLGMVLSGRGVAFDQGMVARKEPASCGGRSPTASCRGGCRWRGRPRCRTRWCRNWPSWSRRSSRATACPRSRRFRRRRGGRGTWCTAPRDGRARSRAERRRRSRGRRPAGAGRASSPW